MSVSSVGTIQPVTISLSQAIRILKTLHVLSCLSVSSLGSLQPATIYLSPTIRILKTQLFCHVYLCLVSVPYQIIPQSR